MSSKCSCNHNLNCSCKSSDIIQLDDSLENSSDHLSLEEERLNGDPHTLPDYAIKKLINAQYGIVGHHSAVQICPWTFKSLRNKGECYKYIFYGIETHSCAQMSPSVLWCSLNCSHCWRPMEFMKRIDIDENRVDDPEYIIQETVKQRKRLLSGTPSDKNTNMEKFKYAFKRFPSHWAISLSGEPTLYPKLPELIKLLKQNPEVKTVFLVSNGVETDMFLKLKQKDALPTQLYISMIAPNKELFIKYAKPVYKDGWERYIRTLSLLPELKCRKVIRLTIMRGINDSDDSLKGFSELLELAKPDFIEVKSYMYIGMSRQRLKFENMAKHEEILEISNKLLSYLPNYFFRNQSRVSRIVLLKRKDSVYDDRIKSVNG
ncbi:MAG: 4-demethylwyosine synthase TYW1 [Candidatus Micrarchaeota archaeon]|nr:4-demethylwyosine synthase TYW1 [Candidatus Micrarchaeota archaeon]